MTSIEEFELVIVGGGPAGMAAALESRRAGVSTCLLDERPALGGQIYRQFPSEFSVAVPQNLGRNHLDGRRLIDAVEASETDVRTGAVVWGIWENQIAFVRDDSEAGLVHGKCVLLATGAYDRPAIFPGWTLPGVMAAGGAKAMIETQRVLPGRAILLAGSGPLVLAFAAQLHDYGANLVRVLEAAPAPSAASLLRLMARARGNEVLVYDAIRYWTSLLRHHMRLRYSSVIIRAEGDKKVERAITARVDRDWRVIPGTEEAFDVDTICIGYGFTTSSELSQLSGCQQRYDEGLGGYFPVRDEWMRSSVAGIFVAGDGSGVTGSRTAIEEGRLAGIGVAFELGHMTANQAQARAHPVRRRLKQMHDFQRALRRIYEAKAGIYELGTPDTIVCRCEEVATADLTNLIEKGINDPNILKSLTRAGMGRCQGRYCSGQMAALVARSQGCAIDRVRPLTVRPPVRPVPVGAIVEERPQRPGPVEVA